MKYIWYRDFLKFESHQLSLVPIEVQLIISTVGSKCMDFSVGSGKKSIGGGFSQRRIAAFR
jgi:hypothetical protein